MKKQQLGAPEVSNAIMDAITRRIRLPKEANSRSPRPVQMLK